MSRPFHRRQVLAFAAGLPFISLAASGTEPRLAISGYDTVAYFTDGKPVAGDPAFQYQWHDATWQFASAAHRDLFAGDPEHYAAQYDGHCAMGVSIREGHKDTVDPEAWTIVDDRLYLNHTKTSAIKWRQDTATNISRANKNWSTVKDAPEPN